jgi:hypothetical protein
MDLIGLAIVILNTPIALVKGFDRELTYGLNSLLPQYLPSVYQWLLHLPIPLVPWHGG